MIKQIYKSSFHILIRCKVKKDQVFFKLFMNYFTNRIKLVYVCTFSMKSLLEIKFEMSLFEPTWQISYFFNELLTHINV